MTASFKVDTSKGQARNDLAKQWAIRPDDERFLNLTDLSDFVSNRTQVSREHTARLRSYRLSAIADGSIRLDTDHASRLLSHWSFGQLAQRAGAPASYLRSLPNRLAVSCLLEGLVRDDNDCKFYYTPDEIRAVTSPSYGRIFDQDVVSAVRRIAGNGIGDEHWKIPGALDWSTMVYDPLVPVTKETTTLYASDRDVWMFLVDDLNPIEVGKTHDGHPDYLFRGFYVSNSEVGSGVLILAVFYLRGLCCNRIMWGVEDFTEVRIRHTRFAPDRFVREVAPALKAFGQGASTKVIEGVKAAQSRIIAQDDDEVVAFLRRCGLSASRANDVIRVHTTEEKRPIRSIWDSVQGTTALARQCSNADTRYEIEMIAKGMLDKLR